MGVNAADWMLLAIIGALFFMVFFQGQDIKRLEKVMRLQNNINESLNKKVEDLRMGKNFVPAEPGIDDGIAYNYDPRKLREHG